MCQEEKKHGRKLDSDAQIDLDAFQVNDDFVHKDKPCNKKKDIRADVSVCADRLGLSVRDRTVYAAKIVSAMGGDIDNTNINTWSAWHSDRKVKKAKAEEIKEQFEVPKRVVINWDGKMLKLKGGVRSNRVCVYLTGATSDQTRKLLGEAQVVIDLMVDWKVGKEAVAENGACRFVELHLQTPILWVACHHHCSELHSEAQHDQGVGCHQGPWS